MMNDERQPVTVQSQPSSFRQQQSLASQLRQQVFTKACLRQKQWPGGRTPHHDIVTF